MPTISPTQSNVTAALGKFLEAVLPAGTEVVLAQPNRVPEPLQQNFVVMTPINSPRLATNVDGSADVRFTGSIAGGTMQVVAVQSGIIVLGAVVTGPGVAIGTKVTATGTANGGPGTYQVSGSQNVAQRTLSAGGKTLAKNSEFVVQLDFHSIDTTSGDMAQIVSTALRDEYGVNFFAALDPPLNQVVPLYADDPAQRPFSDGEQQVEWRWVLDCHLQADQTITVSQDYADSATVQTKDVSALFPP